MEQEEDSIHGVTRRVFLRRSLIPSSSNSLAMENQREMERRRLENMLSMSTLS
jgi:hypothetical protein